jgi:hypothetical protein
VLIGRGLHDCGHGLASQRHPLLRSPLRNVGSSYSHCYSIACLTCTMLVGCSERCCLRDVVLGLEPKQTYRDFYDRCCVFLTIVWCVATLLFVSACSYHCVPGRWSSANIASAVSSHRETGKHYRSTNQLRRRSGSSPPLTRSKSWKAVSCRYTQGVIMH